MPFSTVKLNDGTEMPTIAFGTGSTMKFQDVTTFVAQALENGFSHLDTAAVYQTEQFVGKAIREAGLNRGQLYITTKYDGGPIRQEVEASLGRLGLKSIDLYLVHGPWLLDSMNSRLEVIWSGMEELKKGGLTKSIGVSNFNLRQLKAVISIANIRPAVNQIFLHPYNWAENKSLIDFSKEHGIVTEAYGSLAPITKLPGGPVDCVLESIGDRIGGTPAQVIFKWLQSKGIVIVTTTTKIERLREYLATAELPDLTNEEIAQIEEAGAKGISDFKTKIALRLLVAVATTIMFYLLLFGMSAPFSDAIA